MEHTDRARDTEEFLCRSGNQQSRRKGDVYIRAYPAAYLGRRWLSRLPRSRTFVASEETRFTLLLHVAYGAALTLRYEPPRSPQLLDIGMPRNDGFQAAREIRSLQPHALLVAVSGWPMRRDFV